MELIIFALILLGVIVMIMVLQFINSKREDKRYLLKLQNEFGKSDRYSSYDKKRLLSADAYFKRHIPKEAIDDITWNDLSMDEIYMRMDTTESDAGRQVLYHILRVPLMDREAVADRRSVIDFWKDKEALRQKVLICLHHVGHIAGSSVYDMTEGLESLEGKSFKGYFIRIAALILSFISIYPLGGVGVVLFIVVFISNIYVYYRDRAEILPYLNIYAHLLRLMDASEDIFNIIRADNVTQPYIDGLRDETDKTLASLKPIRRKSRMAIGSERGGDPLYVIIGLVGVVVYADIIRFWRLKDAIIKNRADIDRLIFLTGSMDAHIAMAGYVKGIEKHICAAHFTDDKRIRLEDITHPLIDEPVPNSIDIDQSILLTGANASGKSTFLRSVAIALIYAQTYGYVCAKSYSAPICTIDSAMSVSDDITGGDSYYMAEIKAVKRMMDRYEDAADGDILHVCLVDELLNGTNTEERIAASTQILKAMDQSGRRVLAATHDIELTYLIGGKTFINYHFEENLSESDVDFSYKLMDGEATSRNAISLLKRLGFDDAVVDAANEMVRIHETQGIWQTND